MDGNIRKLASIQRIDEIKDHNNSDNLELAKIGGWQVVVKRGQFKAGDLCIYCEIDCQMPERPEFEFLRDKHFRIKTIKLRGALSQGIVFSLDILGNYIENHTAFTYGIGTEVTDILGIKKYESPIPPQLMGMAKGSFPTYIVPKTDEERLQSRMSLLDEMCGIECYITMKEDGTSFTAYYNSEFKNGHNVALGIEEPIEVFGVCSRNLELKNEAFPNSDLNIYWKIAKQYNIEEKTEKIL